MIIIYKKRPQILARSLLRCTTAVLIIVALNVPQQLCAQGQLFLPLTKIGLNQGLSSPNVRRIVQDKYGFIWLATQDGLNRFDGVNIIQFNSNLANPKRSLTGSDVYDLALDMDRDNIWILTAYGGLDKVNVSSCAISEKFHIPVGTQKMELPWFKCMAKTINSILIGNNEGSVFKFNIQTSQFKKVYLYEQFGIQASIDKIYIDPFDQVWLFLKDKGILITDTNLQRKIHFIDKLYISDGSTKELNFTDFVSVEDKLLVTTTVGLKVFSQITTQRVDIKAWWPGFPSFISEGDLHSANATNAPYILIAGNHELYQLNYLTKEIKKIFFSRNPDDHKWLTLCHSIYQTKQSILIGSQYGMAWIRNVSTPFTGYFTSMNGNLERIDHGTTICPINDSTTVVCADDGLYLADLNSSNIRRFGPRDFYFSAVKISKQYILASGVKNGVRLFNVRGIEEPLDVVFPELTAMADELLISSACYKDSIWFFATQSQNGIYKWDIRRKNIQIIDTGKAKNALKSNVINRLLLDKAGDLWIVCDNVVSIYDPATDSIRHIDILHPFTKLQLSIIMDVCEHNGKYWLGVYGTGLIELDRNLQASGVYSYQNGLNNIGIYKIFSFNDSIIIASTNNGLSLFNTNTKRAVNYFEYDGLQSSSFEETSGNMFGNYLLFGGINGFTKVEPLKFVRNNEKPKLFFSDLTIQYSSKTLDTFNIHISQLDVESDVEQVTINFSALNFIYPEKVQYLYKIKGINDSWTSLGSKNSLELMGIIPGAYHLTVKAINEDGVESDPIQLYMRFEPKWYQTLWFQLVIIGLIFILVYAVYRYRLVQLRKEENIRTRIASDLHDDLGSTLNSIKVYVNLALLHNDNRDYLLKTMQGAQEAISGLRDVIWILDDKEDTIEQLSAKVTRFAKPLCEADDITFNREIESSLYGIKLKKEAKRNIYLTLKEAINNSIKYSGCSEIALIIKTEGQQTSFIIKDNGKGFDTTKPSHGNGLKNIHFRAKQAYYKASIESVPGQGTTITLTK